MTTADMVRRLEQLQNRIAGMKELPETVRSDVMVALADAGNASDVAEMKASLDAAIAALKREAGANAETAELVKAIRDVMATR